MKRFVFGTCKTSQYNSFSCKANIYKETVQLRSLNKIYWIALLEKVINCQQQIGPTSFQSLLDLAKVKSAFEAPGFLR